MNVNEMKKRMTARKYKLRQRVRTKNARTHSSIRKSNGEIVRVTSKMRRAMRQQGRHLARIAGRSSVQRKAKRTKRMRHGFYKESVDGLSGQHAVSFIMAVSEFVAHTGKVDVGVALLENFAPELTSTPIGMFALDASGKIDEMGNGVGTAFVDVVVFDESTFGVTFENAESLTPQVLERCLKEFGEVTALAEPGQAIDENETSDMFMFAVKVPKDKLSEASSCDKSDKKKDDEDEDDMDESIEISEAEIQTVYADPCFEHAFA